MFCRIASAGVHKKQTFGMAVGKTMRFDLSRGTLIYSAATDQTYDVVLVDTAGRMQDNEPLMRSLAKVCSFETGNLLFN